VQNAICRDAVCNLGRVRCGGDWTEFTNKEGSWAIGSLGSIYGNRVVETPWAVWIIRRGELIRLDRAILDKILKP
jgi:hypothetical protein